MAISAKKLAHALTLLELIALFVGGSIIACYMLNTSLLYLVLVTLGWLLVIFLENMAINSNSYPFLASIGAFRLLALTGICIAPIALSSYYSQTSGV